MKMRGSTWVCTHCGYSSSKRFDDDICPRCHLTFWKCMGCAFTLIEACAPGMCPECGDLETFVNITCYIPDWDDSQDASSENLYHRV